MAEPDVDRDATHAAAADASRAPRPRPRRFAALATASSPAEAAVAILTAASALALVASTFATVVQVSVSQASCVDLAGPAASECTKTGFDQHSAALPLLALLVLAMGLLRAAHHAPGPALVVAACGAVAIAIALIVDVPQASRTGALGPEYTQAAAHAGNGLWLELAGGVLAIAAGALGYRLRRQPT
ncbi:MAG: hypothetical protein NVSMB25_05870 [Thermoleophilaceae bacterium]